MYVSSDGGAQHGIKPLKRFTKMLCGYLTARIWGRRVKIFSTHKIRQVRQSSRLCLFETQMYLQQRIVIHSPSFMLTFQASYKKHPSMNINIY